MSTLDRVAAFLVEPAAPPTTRVAVPAACRAAVLGAVGDVVPLAAALALTLRARDRRPAALVALWGAPLPAAAPSTRTARRMAAAVSPLAPAPARGAATAGATRSANALAVARGRLAWLELPAEPRRAVDVLVAAAAVVDAPLVTALAGARPAALDDLVAGHDLVVVASDPGSGLAEAALERLAERGVPAAACPPLARGIRRALAMGGLAAPRLDPAGAQGPRGGMRDAA